MSVAKFNERQDIQSADPEQWCQTLNALQGRRPVKLRGDIVKLFVKTMIAIPLTIVASAPSQARYACAVKQTADGFVALRKGPSAQDPVAGTMKPQELVGLLHPPDYENIVRKGDWLFVRWSPGTRRTEDHIPAVEESKVRTGWVRDKLIDCFEE